MSRSAKAPPVPLAARSPAGFAPRLGRARRAKIAGVALFATAAIAACAAGDGTEPRRPDDIGEANGPSVRWVFRRSAALVRNGVAELGPRRVRHEGLASLFAPPRADPRVAGRRWDASFILEIEAARDDPERVIECRMEGRRASTHADEPRRASVAQSMRAHCGILEGTGLSPKAAHFTAWQVVDDQGLRAGFELAGAPVSLHLTPTDPNAPFEGVRVVLGEDPTDPAAWRTDLQRRGLRHVVEGAPLRTLVDAAPGTELAEARPWVADALTLYVLFAEGFEASLEPNARDLP